MAIPQHTIDQILDRIDLVELIGSRIKLKKAGKTYTACCPFHQEKSPSFNVDRNKGFYHCFGCHAHGNAIGFLMQYENRNFIDVIKDLSQQSGIELPKNSQEDNNKFNYKRSDTKKAATQQLTPKLNPTSNQSSKSAALKSTQNPATESTTNNTSASIHDDPFDITQANPEHALSLDDLWQGDRIPTQEQNDSGEKNVDTDEV